MQNTDLIRCRVAACREALGKWNFYLLNDSNDPLDLAVLYEIGYEWGDFGNSDPVDVRVTDLSPGEHALVWSDDGSGAELRMELVFRVRLHGREAEMRFEFSKLYRLADEHLKPVKGLGKHGFQVAVEAQAK